MQTSGALQTLVPTVESVWSNGADRDVTATWHLIQDPPVLRVIWHFAWVTRNQGVPSGCNIKRRALLNGVHQEDFWIYFNSSLSSLSPTESISYDFGPGRGVVLFTYPEDRRPDTRGDTIAFGFVTADPDAVLLRIDSATSSDYLEIELVRRNGK